MAQKRHVATTHLPAAVDAAAERLIAVARPHAGTDRWARTRARHAAQVLVGRNARERQLLAAARRGCTAALDHMRSAAMDNSYVAPTAPGGMGIWMQRRCR